MTAKRLHTAGADNPQAIITRIRELMAMRSLSQGAFARSIGVDPTNMSKHLSGKLPITDGLINRIAVEQGVSKLWLLTGEGGVFDKPQHPTYMGVGQTERDLRPHGTPIYDIDVAAGTTQLSQMFTDDRIIGHISLPNLRTDNVIVRVSGDSMMPVIAPGAYIAINPDTAGRSLLWGQIYVVVTEDFRLVKYLRKADNPEQVRLVSANSEYDDMIVDRADIVALYLVEAIINYNLRC